MIKKKYKKLNYKIIDLTNEIKIEKNKIKLMNQKHKNLQEKYLKSKIMKEQKIQ